MTILDLSRNDFGEETGVKLAQAFAGMPAGVTTLNLSGNKLHLKTAVELAQAFAGIRESTQEITLNLADIISRTQEELIALGQALPYGMTLHVLDGLGNPADHPAAR